MFVNIVFHMSLSEELRKRGFIYQFSGDSLEAIIDGDRRVFYIGVDPTAPSLTVGNLAIYMLVRHLSDAGHKPILVVGGGTGMIGDPGGKDKERPLLDEKTLRENVSGITNQVRKILGEQDVIVVNNYDWLSKLDLIGFLRDVGKHFTVNSMIKKDIVKNRLDAGSPISFTEFSYSILQAYDFRHLFDTYNCTLQISGSDQWTNVLAGVDFIRKTRGESDIHALTMPLIINPATGKKFGKSEEGALWLDANLTSPYKLYQYFFNVEDSATDLLLKIYTLLSLDEIEELLESARDNPGLRLAQKTLAYEVVKFVHGRDIADSVKNASGVLFGNKKLSDLSKSEIDILKSEAPVFVVTSGLSLVDVLSDGGLANGKTQARKLISDGAVKINGIKIDDIDARVDTHHFSNGIALLKKGKKNILVLLESDAN